MMWLKPRPRPSGSRRCRPTMPVWLCATSGCCGCGRFTRLPEGRTLRLEVTIMRLIVGMTGATGALLGIRLLEHLAQMPEVETHLVLSRWARTTIELETGMSGTRSGDARLADGGGPAVRGG